MSLLPATLASGAVLRALTVDDVPALFDAIDADRARLGAWFPWIESTRSPEDEAAWIRGLRSDPRNRDGLGIFVDGDLAGSVGLAADEFGVSAEIGYWIRPEFEGRGLVTDSVRLLLREAFEHVGLHRVSIHAGVDNLPSRAIAERLGFREEGLLRGAARGSGGFYDLVIYGCLDHEWRAGTVAPGTDR